MKPLEVTRRGVIVNEGTSITPETSATPATSAAPSARETQQGSPYGFYIVALALVLVSLIAFSALLIFKTLFENATDVTTVLASLFAVVGTLVGAYFGVKASSDATDKTQGAVERANETANRALAEMDPEAGRRVIRDTSRTTV